MIAQEMAVGPELARLWLEKNNSNRKLREHHINQLAQEMKEGAWVLNGDTIKFNSNGTLIDGQHRLTAIIKSDCTIQTLVVFGIDNPTAFMTIDTNSLTRAASTLGEQAGLTNSIKTLAVARRLLYWEKMPDKKDFTFNTELWRTLLQRHVIDYAKAHEDEIANTIFAIDTSAPYKRCGVSSALVSALIVCKRINPIKGQMFIDAIKTGANLTENSPVRLLRERLTYPPEKRYSRMAWELEVMALVFKVFNYYLNNKPMKTLRWRQAGDMAESFPVPGAAA